MAEGLIEMFPDLPLEVAIKQVEAINRLTILLLYLFIVILIVSIIFTVSLYYLSPYSSFLLNMFAKQQAAYFAMQDTQLVEIQKHKILKGEGMGPFPCLNIILKKIKIN